MKKIILLINIFILTFFSIIIVNIGLYAYAFITPKFQINTSDNIVFLDKNGNSIFDDESINNYVEFDDISVHVKNAIISIEDKNFYSHSGFDFLRIIKALFTNIVSGEIRQGASTISQQYIKNLYLTFDQTWKRKIEEAFLTIELETHYDKNDILEGYLNVIDFGSGTYGIYEASKYYFNKLPKELTIEEASILVGIPKNPSYYNPISNFDNAKKRQKEVLNSMYKNGYIDKNMINQIHKKEIIFYGKRDRNELSSVYYYKDAVLNELKNIKNMPKTLLEVDKLQIHTNLDINVQKTLENNINSYMNDTTLQVASIVVTPSNGKIISLVGGKDYALSQYNRAVNSKRQVGSTIKPFLYYAALENGFTPSSTFLSERTTFNLGDSTYSPKNANNRYANKNISMLSAISYSDNIYAMKTHLFLGTDLLSKTMKRVGVKTQINQNASDALGTSEINIIDYSNAYITLANEGKHENPHLIEKITDSKGNVLYEYKYKEEYVLNNKYVYILNNMLTSTYDYDLVSYASPTLLSISSDLDGKYAAKSGSTEADYWTIGYNKNYLVMVWAGNDNNDPVLSKDAKITKKIWSKTISNIDSKKEWYDIPEGVVASVIDPISGEFSPKGYICYFEKGSEPNNKSHLLYE